MSRSFQNNGVSPQGKNVVILGSGGTSKTAQAYLKESGAKKVFAHSPKVTGIGLAVYNRLIRAAGFDVIEL